MSMRSTFALLLLGLAALRLSAAPGVGPTGSANYQTNARTHPATSQTSSLTINCTDLSSSTGATSPSCWDSLEMNQWMFNWNSTTKTCEHGESWSTCFLRLAYGSPGYDCSTLGSLDCSPPRLGGPIQDPRVFCGAYNIFTVNTYFTAWELSLQAVKSQPAIAQLAQALGAGGDGGGLPALTTSSLLAAIVSHYGLDATVDQAFISILPTGRGATKLDTSVTPYPTQLATLLAELLEGLSSDPLKGDFLFLAQHGQMMAYTGESLPKLDASLAGELAESVADLENDQ